MAMRQTLVPSPTSIADARARLKWEEPGNVIEYVKVEVELDYNLWGAIRVV